MSLGELPPPRLDYIWQWFCKLTGWRQIGMGLGAIPHTEIEAWARLMHFRISPAEVECIRELDLVYRAYVSEKHAPARPPSITAQFQAIVDSREGKRILAEQQKARGKAKK